MHSSGAGCFPGLAWQEEVCTHKALGRVEPWLTRVTSKCATLRTGSPAPGWECVPLEEVPDRFLDSPPTHTEHKGSALRTRYLYKKEAEMDLKSCHLVTTVDI